MKRKIYYVDEGNLCGDMEEVDYTRVIFQDVDGPLIPGRMYYRKEARYDTEKACFLYDPVAVDMLRTLCEKYGARIVFNTAHNEEKHEAMRYKARINGFEDLLHEDCRTEFCVTNESRLGSCYQWIEKHPEVTEWIVIDDEKLNDPHQVHINFSVGMTIDNFFMAEQLFGNKKAGLLI